MTDLVIAPANVIAQSNASVATGTAGATIAQGQLVYKDTASGGKYLLADNNVVLQEARKAVGIALNGASLNQPISVQTAGDIALGAVLTAGTDYFLSGAPGMICPRADVITGMSVCLVGLAKSTTVLNIDVQFPGVQL